MEKNEAIFTLHYLPDLAWFSAFCSAEKSWIEKHDNFQKASFRNRAIINTANGTQLLSIPVMGGRDKHQRYCDVKICYAQNWQKQHWQSICSAYGSAPFFEHYADYIAPFYNKHFELLFDFNRLLLEKILLLLKQNPALSFTSDFQLSYENIADFRVRNAEKKITPYIQVFSHKNRFNPNVAVLDLLFCEGTNAMNYLSVR